MSSLDSPSSGPPTSSVSNDALAAAAELRTPQAGPKLTAAQMAAEHEKRLKFGRLLDPGITRPNSKEQALSSLKTLLTIAENLLREPNNPKFQQFKPTNSIIKRDLIDPKGALEFAIEPIQLGFRGKVQGFQPYYTFNQRHMEDLRIGSSILKNYISLETEKQERAARAKKNEKVSIEAAAEKADIYDPLLLRRSKLLRDEMEREQRTARALAAARQATIQELSPPITPESAMPGSGHVLGLPMTNPDEPPVYEEILD